MPRPNQKPKTFLQETFLTPVQEGIDRVMRRLFGVTKSWRKMQDIARNNYELGVQHLELGNIPDAILRLNLVVRWLEPGHADAWYRLGCAYLAADKKEQARQALKKALQLKKSWPEASYMLAIANGKEAAEKALPRQIPPALALAHFDSVAADFTRQQLDDYQYRGHVLLTDAVRAAAVSGRLDHVVLELGVGTGLVGPLIRDISAHITGVDFSAAMLAEALKVQDAQGKKIYDALIRRELADYLAEAPPHAFDMVLAAGVLSYLGDLAPLFPQAARVLKPGGLFAFTADRLEDGDFRFDPELGRFRYSAAYLKDLAMRHGMPPRHFEEAAIYNDFAGFVAVFQKT